MREVSDNTGIACVSAAELQRGALNESLAKAIPKIAVS
jgi:hypothetical protein